MKNFLPITEFTLEAKEAKNKNKWWGVILMTLAIFFASQIAESIFLTPCILIYFLTNQIQYSQGFESGKFEISYNAALELPDWIMIIMLLMTVITIIGVILYCTKSEKRSLSSIGFNRYGMNPSVEYLIGFVIGLVMFTCAWSICIAIGAATFSMESITPNVILILFTFLIGYLIQGLSEEVLCRGFMMQSMAASYPAFVAIISNSILFALMHLGNSGISPLALVNLALFGAFASVYMWKRGNIWGVAAIHSAWNFVQGNILGVSVSGNQVTTSVLRTSIAPELQVVNGGAFGMEGGLAVTAVLVVGILIVLFALPINKNIELQSSEIC